MSIGFVGAGRMGLPMVRRLAAAGEDVRVLVRSSHARSDVSEARATGVTALADLAGGAAAVVICVHKDEQVREICYDNGLLEVLEPETVLIIHTTGSPMTAQQIQESAAGRGIRVADAPVSGGPDDIAAGCVTVFLGGSPEAVDGAVEVLSRYADPIHRVGPLGSGQLMKLVNNSIFLSNIEIISAATKFGLELGMDESAMLECLREGSANSYALGGVAAVGGADDFKKTVAEFLNKDVDVVLAVAAATDTDLGVIGSLLRADVGRR